MRTTEFPRSASTTRPRGRVVTCNAPEGVQYIRDRIRRTRRARGRVELREPSRRRRIDRRVHRRDARAHVGVSAARRNADGAAHSAAPDARAAHVVPGCRSGCARSTSARVGELGGSRTHAEGIFPFVANLHERRRARAADDGDPARRVPRRAGHLQHVHAVRRARASLRAVERSRCATFAAPTRAFARFGACRSRPAVAATTSSCSPTTA